ncbi:histidine triad nucleotide-binding protein 3-like [Planoprotostelium fungivorum]|uniref:Histidine triad nucleotide-binding protein 3-like n=1 Tax=Planoprotostelium fungivorum TaxID=1890364 RepID=A0A2P6NH52_9EUKA|nr:histidine triad nucleotide-binding protein 3-like [Planoprotostelium fungivorum]
MSIAELFSSNGFLWFGIILPGFFLVIVNMWRSYTLSRPCVFCAIKVGKEPANIVCQNEGSYCMEDRNPMSARHLLVVPKQHIDDLNVDTIAKHQDAVDSMLAVARKVMKDLSDSESRWAVGFTRPSFVTVPHLHMHLIQKPITCSFFRSKIKLNAFVHQPVEEFISEIQQWKKESNLKQALSAKKTK